MTMNTLLKLTTISGLALLLTACSSTQDKVSTKSLSKEQEVKKEAMIAIKKVATSFQMTLNQKAKEGGLSNAAKFCSTNANTLAKQVSKTLKDGVTLRRITDKPRNIGNRASDEELLVLNEIKTKLQNGQKVDMIVKQKAPNRYEVYKPIMIAKKCLNCHGNETSRNQEAYSIIAKKYPHDQAINYKVNDFRGAFLVTVITQ